MPQPIRVLGFAGSLRKASFNAGLLRAAQEMLPDGMALEVFDLLPIPLYNADVEAHGFPEAVTRFRERIAAADALLIATPEYNYSIPGVLKNAIDWASRPPGNTPLDGKTVALMGASPGMMGTSRCNIICGRFAFSSTCCHSTSPKSSSPRPIKNSTPRAS